MFRNPINAFPYANAVDLTINGNQVPFSFTFQGDVLRQWCVEIKDIDTDTVYYTTDVQDNINTPKYNGDICTVTLTAGVGITATTAITNFSWSVYMNDSTSLITDTASIKTDSGTYQSNEFYFINSNIPAVTNSYINGVTVPDGSVCTISSRQLDYEATYNTNLTNTPLKYYNVTIVDYQGNVIVQTEDRYSSNIKFTFDGLNSDPDHSYNFILTLMSQAGLQNTYTYLITCNYSDTASTMFQSVTYDKKRCANVINWYKTMSATGDATGTYNFNNSKVDIDTGTITYNNINGSPIIIDPNNFSYSFNVTLSPEQIWGQEQSKIFHLGSDDKNYHYFYVANGKLSANFYSTYNTTVFANLYNFYTTDKFAIQNTATVQPNVRYIWTSNTTDIWRDSASYYWLTNFEGADITVRIRVETLNGALRVYVNDISRANITYRFPNITSMPITVTLFAPNIYDNFILNKASNFSNTEINILATTPENLSWADFQNAVVICNYIDNINSTSSELGTIVGYAIQRQEQGDEKWVTIFNVDDLSILPETSDIYSITDYNIKNNRTYVYRLCPILIDSQQRQRQGEYGELSASIYTDWESFTLTPLNISVNEYNSQYKNASPIQVNGQSQVWSFSINCEESALSKNQDKTYFNTFVKFPKVSAGKLGYFTVSLTALLGSIDENCYYYEPKELLEQWNTFIDSNYICLYKNLKGDARIVSINPDSSNTYANFYATQYNDEQRIGIESSRPTTISVNLTEIDDAEFYTIVGLGD